jgi:hypothetical protein
MKYSYSEFNRKALPNHYPVSGYLKKKNYRGLFIFKLFAEEYRLILYFYLSLFGRFHRVIMCMD